MDAGIVLSIVVASVFAQLFWESQKFDLSRICVIFAYCQLLWPVLLHHLVVTSLYLNFLVHKRV